MPGDIINVGERLPEAIRQDKGQIGPNVRAERSRWKISYYSGNTGS